VIIAADIDSLSNVPLRSRAGAARILLTFLRGDTVMIGTSRPKEKDLVRVVTDADGRIRGVVNGADAKDHFTARLTSKSPDF